jgi:hypothetical protein
LAKKITHKLYSLEKRERVRRREKYKECACFSLMEKRMELSTDSLGSSRNKT